MLYHGLGDCINSDSEKPRYEIRGELTDDEKPQ